MLFILWLHSYDENTLSFTSRHHPMTDLAHINCLININIQQVSMNVNGYYFFLYGGIHWNILIKWHIARLLLNWYPKQSKKCIGNWQESSTPTTIPPLYVSVEQNNKIEDITLKATHLWLQHAGSGLLLQLGLQNTLIGSLQWVCWIWH